MVVEQSPQSGGTLKMVDFNNAESSLGRQSELLEEFLESLNKVKEEEGTCGEARVQGPRVEAPAHHDQPSAKLRQSNRNGRSNLWRPFKCKGKRQSPKQSKLRNQSSSQVVARARSGRRSQARMIVVTSQAQS